jgi:hypothetical protein
VVMLTGNFGANGNQDDGRLARYRRFESAFLQRRWPPTCRIEWSRSPRRSQSSAIGNARQPPHSHD